ncbi:hypothetical protein NLP62_24510, partial [Escherichia coli]|nr:hypothetical protein [Escherichia coli]
NPPFARPALQPLFDLPPVLFNPGESRVAWQAGIPLVSISGTNPYHHTRLDDEQQIWQPAVGPMMEAYTEVVDGLLGANLNVIRFGNLGVDLINGPPPDALPCAGMPAGFR